MHLEMSTCDPLKYKMDDSILIVTICMEKFHQKTNG